MPIQILMPALSPTMTEGNLVKWHKKEGDTIKAGQILAEIETDKATMEIEAVDEGILGRIVIQEGTEEVKVNALIGLILEEGEDASALDAFVGQSAGAAPVAVSNASTPVVAETGSTPVTAAAHAGQAAHANQAGQAEGARVFASPLARRIAGDKGIPLAEVTGTGPRGRIVKDDVLGYSPRQASAAHTSAQAAASYTDVSLTSMRKTIAKRLTEAKQTIPHFYLTVDCELDALMKLRADLNALPNAVKLSVNDFVIRACALALKEVPEANATFHDTYVRQYDAADVAVAVAIDGGLVTPVLRGAEAKSVRTLSVEMKSLADRARNGKLKPEDYQGGGFTLSNLGMFGVKQFGAIINPPQASILAVGAGEPRAIVKNGAIVAATVMSCTLSVDHRAIDGAVGARFLAAFKQFVENPLTLLV